MEVTQKKQLIETLLNKFAATVNADGEPKIKHVELFSGIKPSGYYLPYLQIGSNPPVEHPTWYVEIWVNHECAYRYGATDMQLANRPEGMSEYKRLQEQESGLLDKLLSDTFTCGLWNFHTEIAQQKKPEILNAELNDRIFQCGAEIGQLFWIAGQQESPEYGGFWEQIDTKDFREMMPEIAAHVNFPRYAKNQEWQSAMVDFAKLGLVAECYYPELIDFTFKADGSVQSWVQNQSVKSIFFVYGETRLELVSKIEAKAKQLFELEVQRAKKNL